MSTVAPDVIFDHIGVFCDDVARELEAWSLMGYAPRGEGVHDATQQAICTFLDGPGPRVELIQPQDGPGTGDQWTGLRRSGVKMYHLAFRTRDLQQAVDRYREAGAKILKGATGAPAFDGCPVVFLMLRNGLVIELIGSEGDRP